MVKFTSLEPEEAKRLEEAAVTKYNREKSLKPEQSEEIYRIKAMFPFQFFPDELIVYRNKITSITRVGPAMSMTRDIHLHDIAQVEADVGPIFGHLHVYPKLRTEEPILIDRLRRADAIKAREVIEKMIEEAFAEKESTY